MSLFLRIASVLALLRAVGLLFFQAAATGSLAPEPLYVALMNGLAAANIGFAFLFWRAAGDPVRERSGVYTALLFTGLRAAGGTYEILYLLDGGTAVVCLIDMVASLALFVGILNTLPATLREGRESPNSDRG